MVKDGANKAHCTNPSIDAGFRCSSFVTRVAVFKKDRSARRLFNIV